MTDDYEPAEIAEDELDLPRWEYPTLVDWMENWFLIKMFRYDNQHRRWCPEWWRHPYAIERLSALWQSWELMYMDSSSISAWWVYHFDAHWPALTSEIGPFRDCGKGHEDDASHPLPHVSPPREWSLPREVSEA